MELFVKLNFIVVRIKYRKMDRAQICNMCVCVSRASCYSYGYAILYC